VAKLEGNHVSLPVWAMIRIQPQVPVLTSAHTCPACTISDTSAFGAAYDLLTTITLGELQTSPAKPFGRRMHTVSGICFACSSGDPGGPPVKLPSPPPPKGARSLALASAPPPLLRLPGAKRSYGKGKCRFCGNAHCRSSCCAGEAPLFEGGVGVRGLLCEVSRHV
jgi:hypothetical protein